MSDVQHVSQSLILDRSGKQDHSLNIQYDLSTEKQRLYWKQLISANSRTNRLQ